MLPLTSRPSLLAIGLTLAWCIGASAQAPNVEDLPTRSTIDKPEGGHPARALPLEPLPAPRSWPPEASPRAEEPTPPPLELEHVLAAVERSYPLLAAVERDRVIAAGKLESSIGKFFDTKVTTLYGQEILGFYRNERFDASIEQNTGLRGAKLEAGYKLGLGSFIDADGNMQTNDGGEFRAGMAVPMLRDGSIDRRRANIAQAELGRAAAEPKIYKQRLNFIKGAAKVYWTWVGTGQKYMVAQSLLNVAMERDRQLRIRVEKGDIAEIEQIDNLRVVYQRQAKVTESQREFQRAAILLSLFVRNDAGLPALPPADRLPPGFPQPPAIDPARVDEDIRVALVRRPELQVLEFERRKLRVELEYARNQCLPALDLAMKGSQDIGGQDPKRNKGPFELEAGVLFQAPLQRRDARGQIRAAQAEIDQITAELRYAQDSVVADVQDAMSALLAARDRAEQSRQGAIVARQVEQLERKKFELGNSTLLIVNLREQATFDARVLELEALSEFYKAIAEYRAALAWDADPIGTPPTPPRAPKE